MPSGHVMGVATLMYYLFNRYSTSYKPLLTFMGTLLIALVGVSRVHTGSHFPSQVFAGLVIAYALAYAVHRGTAVVLSQMHTWRSSKVINCAVTLVIASYVCAFAELNLLQLLGADPMGSLVLARRGCHSLAAVAKTTSPMKSIARAGGVIFGSGAGVALRQRFSRRHSVLVKGGMGVHSVLVKGGMGVLMRATLTCTALAYAMDAALVAATPDDERLHNAYAVLHNVVLYFMLTWMVPALVVSAERSYRQERAM